MVTANDNNGLRSCLHDGMLPALTVSGLDLLGMSENPVNWLGKRTNHPTGEQTVLGQPGAGRKKHARRNSN
jgi:hypothetical protein